MSAMPEGPTIAALGPDDVVAHLPALVTVLRNAVDAGASVGFLPPLSEEEARDYWLSVVAALREGSRLLLVARQGEGPVVGAVQLDLAQRPNALHRAEVSKLMVHNGAGSRGR